MVHTVDPPERLTQSLGHAPPSDVQPEVLVRPVAAQLMTVSTLVSLLASCGSGALVGELPPVLSRFSPREGPPGTTVTLTGENLGEEAVVHFNGAMAKVTAASRTSLAAVVPDDATTGPISVTVLGLRAVSSRAFTVSAGEPPSITRAPANQVVVAGADVALSTEAAGTPPLTYQWLHDGVPLTGATKAGLTLSAVQASQTGAYAVTVSNAFGSVTSAPASVTLASRDTAPVITTHPSSLTVAPGASATFSVKASGTAPLSYAWAREGMPLGGATDATYTIANVTAAHGGRYTVTVSNSAGKVTSNPATLTVSSAPPALSRFNLTGFGASTTGGGVVAATDATYRTCSTPLELATAIRDANKTEGAVRVIEVMKDLDLGWNEVGSEVQSLSGTPFRQHNAATLHPALIAAGVSLVDIKPKGGGLTLFSASGATLRHVSLNVKSTSNLIIRNLKFDELWEWDEATKGNYDANDWDFLVLGNGGTVTNVWIDHCTFTKSYDGAVDIKGGSSGITLSWCTFPGDDGATNPKSFVRQQLASLEAGRASYAMYDFFRTNGFSVDDLFALHQGHDKTHLIGATEFAAENASFTVTLHHQWYRNTWDRHPRLRGGQVHVYNVLVDDTDALRAVRRRDALVAAMTSTNQATANDTYKLRPALNGSIATEGGAVLVEKSVYLDSLWPLRNNQTDPNDSAYTGKILARDTIATKHDASGAATSVRGDSTDPGNPLGPVQAAVIPFSWNGFSTLPYAYALDEPDELAGLLQASAGAGVMTWEKTNWLKTSY